MSHLVTIKTELRDLAAIRAACKRMGWELVEGQPTFRAYYGTENCDHAIRVPSAEYEIGLRQDGQKLTPHWDPWETGGLADVTHENGMGGFLQAYAIEMSKLEARRKGYQVTERTLPNGNVKLEVAVP